MEKSTAKTKMQEEKHTHDLVISKSQNEELSLHQLEFNKLVRKIESLRSELHETTLLLDSQLDYLSKNIYPIEIEMLERKKDVVKLLFPFYADKSILSQNQRKILYSLIRGLMQDILTRDKQEPDADLQNIFEALEGVSYNEVVEQSFESTKDDLERMFKNMGVDVDFSDLHKDMTEEEISERVRAASEKVKQTQEYKKEQKVNSKKSKKENAKIEKQKLLEEAKNKNVSSIYKQLVKILHPDLEQDDEQRPIKEELMKQLSIAYKNNDLHALLKLELQWVNMAQTNTKKLTDDKLNIYNQMLKEQVDELKNELKKLNHDPRYLPLEDYHDMYYYQMPQKIDMSQVKRDRQRILETLKDSVENLKGNKAMRELKGLLQIHKAQMRGFD